MSENNVTKWKLSVYLPPNFIIIGYVFFLPAKSMVRKD